MNEKKIKKKFKTEKRFSSLSAELSLILESCLSDVEKLEAIKKLNTIATGSICRICLFEKKMDYPIFSDGLCRSHYAQRRASNRKLVKVPQKSCSVPGCENKYAARGYCSLHYSRVYTSGVDPNDIVKLSMPKITKRL
ncbi:hypothetical protein [Paenibacillus lutrae]|uniref:Uncharacterized protein n=1 Tax=Paenibacillus lutrae TaxID=2078573 RepID=A0A7X3K1G0_9BACL|nr:hypothetical protein [Paenibacillus lutrae]MVP02080.1 hypothetical protein [Paenibacillus lutrae]